MKKLLTLILIILLLVISALIAWQGIQLGNFRILSIQELIEENDNLDEKIKIYRKLEKEKIFKLTKEQKENWLKQQLDITIIYFINGSKPNVYNFYKIIKWYKKNVGNNKNIKQFIKLYIKSRKSKESFI